MSFAQFDPPRVLPLELRLNMLDMPRTLETMVDRARTRRGFTLFTVNLDHIVKLGRSKPFREAYSRADLISADGWPIVWLARGQDRRQASRPDTPERRRAARIQRTTGADLLDPMCRDAAAHGLSVYFIGPSPISQANGIAILRARYPALDVAGCETPDVPADVTPDCVDAIARRLERSGARICVVSLGAPKQELLADKLRQRCPDIGFLCVGAALDFISGHMARAPLWAQRAGLEWFWRMICDPRRLALRYALCAAALFKMTCPTIFRASPRLVVIEDERPAP